MLLLFLWHIPWDAKHVKNPSTMSAHNSVLNDRRREILSTFIFCPLSGSTASCGNYTLIRSVAEGASIRAAANTPLRNRFLDNLGSRRTRTGAPSKVVAENAPKQTLLPSCSIRLTKQTRFGKFFLEKFTFFGYFFPKRNSLIRNIPFILTCQLYRFNQTFRRESSRFPS